jgi:hypothetical protein
VVVDEAELHVETDVLVDVADGVVRLGAEDRADLVDAFKDADHDLLVELWALGQEGGAAEVVELEDVGPALRGRGDDLGRLHFGEVAGVHVARKPAIAAAARRKTARRVGWRFTRRRDRAASAGWP